MIVIVDVDAQKFSLDGIEYYKNFTPIVNGDTIRILNTYDGYSSLVNSTNYANFTVDGVGYASAALLQSALLPVLFTRDTLGASDTIGKRYNNANVGGVFALDLDGYDTFNIVLTSATTLSLSETLGVDKVKPFTVYVTGDFPLTLLGVIVWSGAYDGTKDNRITGEQQTDSITVVDIETKTL